MINSQKYTVHSMLKGKAIRLLFILGALLFDLQEGYATCYPGCHGQGCPLGSYLDTCVNCKVLNFGEPNQMLECYCLLPGSPGACTVENCCKLYSQEGTMNKTTLAMPPAKRGPGALVKNVNGNLQYVSPPK